MEGILAPTHKKVAYKAVVLDPQSQTDQAQIDELLAQPYVTLIDTSLSQVEELIKINNPTEKFAPEILTLKATQFLEEIGKAALFNFVFYPWRNTLTVLLKEKEFSHLRTSRNKYKITQEEQDVLSTKIIGVVGLSVGQSVALSLAMERGFGELRIADFDTLELSNMNRIRTSVVNLGEPKTRIVAREIAEIDPYLKVTLFEDGLTEDNMDAFFEKGGKLDLLIEECDNLPIKLTSRLKAKSLGIPVLMDTSDRGMIDIERFDLERERPIFHGKLKEFGEESTLVGGAKTHGQAYFSAFVDFDQLSERARESMAEIGKTITTWPQLASSVLLGGAACGHISRSILLGQSQFSGRFYIDIDQYLSGNK
ncbi:ThiF family adenylyltransferase [Litoribacter alkaliphilus]|uniref:ThiF family adenylyltransferase n=1 Tax=Litoribacter ruber TaxID=702568 RepID=A0AAP2CHY7_9BACT|nr:ThiF family adenylyltransferase [Litoribacter alkaliphilus]MBS9522885.1 ThiF family adenylyltransferase [Litoribacter alkaliphilus]